MCGEFKWFMLIVLYSCSNDVTNGEPVIYGFRVESDVAEEDTGRQGRLTVTGRETIILANHATTLRLFGSDLHNGGLLSFTTKSAENGTNCALFERTETFVLCADSSAPNTALAVVNVPLRDGVYYLCVGAPSRTDLYHQGNASWLALTTETVAAKMYLMPLWLQICVILVLLSFSGLFSGLNLGLMSLDRTELDIVFASGTDTEKKYAKTIRPLRKRGNFLLCTILLGNVMVNNTLTILLDDITGSGLVAVIGSTLSIVIFGEIIPQAFCSRYGLAVGAKTVWFTRFFMFITFPLSYPISCLLDCALGEELGYVYNRDRLRELLRLTEKKMDLLKDEVNIITGALELSKKTVGHIMTRLEDVFMIDSGVILDFETISLIMKSGYSRIPIYKRDRSNIVALFNIKDLAFIDPDDRTPLHTVTQFYQHPVQFVFEDIRLDVMLDVFKKGHSHMALVQRVNDVGPGDPFYEIVGLVTLEDIIEEIIQSEIIDETDTVTDNRIKAPTKKKSYMRDFSVFNKPDEHNYTRLSPQLSLATFQFLTTSVAAFNSELISATVLQKLIKQDVIVDVRITDPPSDDCLLYQAGRPCDYFAMILIGRVQVELGRESLLFESGPFICFGTQALTGPVFPECSSQASITSLTELSVSTANIPAYIPDFTVRAVTDLQYIRIRRAHYTVARRATLIERHNKVTSQSQQDGGGRNRSASGEATEILSDAVKLDQFDEEWKRVGVPLILTGAGGHRARTGSDTLDSTSEMSSEIQIHCSSLDPVVEEGALFARTSSSSEDKSDGNEVKRLEYNNKNNDIPAFRDGERTEFSDIRCPREEIREKGVSRTEDVNVGKIDDVVYHL